MNERDAFLRAICANPDEDTPRLVYADWLDEQGGAEDRARAEFIRLQIEIARQSIRAYTRAPAHERPVDFRPRCKCGACLILRRERQLLVEHGEAWYRDALRPIVAPTDSIRIVQGALNQVPNVRMRRGFPEALTIYPRHFFGAAGELFAINPIVSVRLVFFEPSATRDRGWCWSRTQLPELFELLPIEDTARVPVLRRTRAYVTYQRYEHADEALSAAAVAHGRGERDRLRKKGGRDGI